MSYMRGISGDEVRVPERDLNPPDDKPALTADQFAEARDEIIEIVLAFGQWPLWKEGRWTTSEKAFDLYDFLAERTWEHVKDNMTSKDWTGKANSGACLELSELLEFLILALSDHGICGQFAASRDRWEKKIRAWLLTWFDGNEHGRRLVEEHAEKIEAERAEDAKLDKAKP